MAASRQLSPSAMTFDFSTKGSGFHYLSNQAIRLALPGVNDPWGPVRSFSLSSSPSEEGKITVTCKISDTPFKQALSRLRPGDTAEVFGPIGHFLLDRDRDCVFLAGGIGVTPFRGMLRFAHDTGQSRARRLVYSARVPEELIFREELDAITQSGPLQVHYTITRPSQSSRPWTGRVGRIDEAMIRNASEGLDPPKYYVAGLPEMVSEIVEIPRTRLAVPDDDILYEVFRGF